YVRQIVKSASLISAYHQSETFVSGSVVMNLGDASVMPGLSYCSRWPDHTLILDPEFISTRGYRPMREICSSAEVTPWDDRKPVAFWRGMTSGNAKSWQDLPRIALCRLVAEAPSLFDVGLSGISQIPSQEDINAIKASGFMREFVPPEGAISYRYQIDID